MPEHDDSGSLLGGHGKMGVNYYNDNDVKACAWLRELIADGVLPDGVIDERPIQEIKPDELKGYRQHHFFAGVGGWAYALHLAGWPADRPVWTASLPCQSFSCAGKGKGFADDRGQLWFPFLRLVRERRPAIIFGEQVPAAIGKGWLDRIFDDLEAEGYACGSSVLPACSVGALHLRQRLWWVAHSRDDGRVASGERGGLRPLLEAEGEARRAGDKQAFSPELRRPDGGLADGERLRPQGRDNVATGQGVGERCLEVVDWSRSVWWPCRDGKWRRVPGRVAHGERNEEHEEQQGPQADEGGRSSDLDGGRGAPGGLDNATSPRCNGKGQGSEGEARDKARMRRPQCGCANGGLPDAADGGTGRCGETEQGGDKPKDGVSGEGSGEAVCLAGYDRLGVEPALFPLAPRLPGRVVLLRGAGNAIVPQVAALFVKSVMIATEEASNHA